MENMCSIPSKMLLAMESIGKRFPGVQALENVNFDLVEGEIHSIVGANGAGKTTLINILCGVFPDYDGIIKLDNKIVKITNPRKSRKLGISVVSQEFSLIKDFTVAENVYLNSEPRRFGFINKGKMNNACSHWLRKLGIKLDFRKKVSTLSVVECQLVEIIKALQSNSRILILDEPTAVLSGKETKVLYKVMKDLQCQGVSIILISHRFEDVFRVSDRVTVLRDGQKMFSTKTNLTTTDEIVDYMLGKQGARFTKMPTNRSERKLFSVKQINTKKLCNISFDVYEGEVLGVVGHISSGRHELMNALYGISRIQSGTLSLNNICTTIRSPKDAIKLGFGFLSEDRKRDGIFQYLSVADNITMPFLKLFSKMGFLLYKKISHIVQEKVSELDIKTTNLSQHAIDLSGGNQQKVILARWLSNKEVKILLFEEPTRGVDVASKVEIYSIINNLTQKGNACLIMSSELDELLLLCDRILVLEKGSIAEVLNISEISKSQLLKIIMGSSNN
ncbi:sugar ABC transporter ATP-binding protein [Candidatus Dojkabacteria bacterium]|nr:sugar ABC transporter ATP-binding protein [Candidatus Dojkabacteria bacterium]